MISFQRGKKVDLFQLWHDNVYEAHLLSAREVLVPQLAEFCLLTGRLQVPIQDWMIHVGLFPYFYFMFHSCLSEETYN